MKTGQPFKHIDWPDWDKLLGTLPDAQIANMIGCDRTAVAYRREVLGVPTYKKECPQNTMIQCACGCGKMFEKYDSRGRERKFIPTHQGKLQPNRLQIVVCENCGKSIKRPPWHLKKVNHTFCNAQCLGEWRAKTGCLSGKNNGHYNTITVSCAGCGNPVSKAYSLIMRRNNNVYCEDCIPLTKKGRKGFYAGYPKEFDRVLRQKIRRRDGQQCQVCGSHKDQVGTLHVHHIDYNKHNNDPQNLIALCCTCHGKTNFATETWKTRLQEYMANRLHALSSSGLSGPAGATASMLVI